MDAVAAKRFEVDVGYDSATRTRARVRLVDVPPKAEQPPEPKVGDPWCHLTVRARLHRVGFALRRDPRVEPQRERSCMPEPLRDRTVDWPGSKVPMRVPVPSADQDAANVTLRDLLRFKDDAETKAVIYAIVDKLGGDALGKILGCSDTHARKQMKAVLDLLARDWNRWSRPDVIDIEKAKRLIHRK